MRFMTLTPMPPISALPVKFNEEQTDSPHTSAAARIRSLTKVPFWSSVERKPLEKFTLPFVRRG